MTITALALLAAIATFGAPSQREAMTNVGLETAWALTSIPGTASWSGKLQLVSDEPSIGSSDGTSYSIISSQSVNEPMAACGHNDLGIANIGVFVIETRRYETWNKGTLLRTWEEKVKVFQNCSSGP